MTDLEQEAVKFREARRQETAKEASDRSALRFYMGCAMSGLIASSKGYTRPDEIVHEAAEYARAALKKELSGF